MDLILLLILMLVVLIGLPIGLCFLIFSWIKKKEFDKRYRLFSLLPIIIVGYFIYYAIYPDDNFYKEDFKEVTKMEFPDSGEIISKNASFPDQFGDYTSSILVEFDENYIQELKFNLSKNGFVKTNNSIGSETQNVIENEIGDRKYDIKYVKELNNGTYYFVGFLNDNKSLIVTRLSW